MTQRPKPPLTGETLPKATWILCLSSLPPDSGTLTSKGHAQFTFISAHNFGQLASSPIPFCIQPRRDASDAVSCSRVAWHHKCNSWKPCLAYIWACWLLKHWVQLHSLQIPTFFDGFCFPVLSRAQLCQLQLSTSLPSLGLSINGTSCLQYRTFPQYSNFVWSWIWRFH